MYNKAIDKLRDEMADNQGFDMLTELGEMLCRWLKDNRYAAEKILREDKSLEGAIKALEAEARKHRGSKNCLIRILDWCGYAGIDVEKVLEDKHEYNKTRPYKHGKRY